MRTDEDIENQKYPLKKQKKAKKPLVLRDAVDAPKAKSVEWASILDELKAVMPEYPDQTPDDRAATAAHHRRLSNPPAPNVVHRLTRAAREELPRAAQSGLTTSLIAGAQPTNALAPRRISQQPLMTTAAQNPEPEPGLMNALSDVRSDPRRLLPGSGGWTEGVGAAVPHIIASTVDPAGAMLGGAAFKVAGAGAKAAARAVADIPLPTNSIAAARHLMSSEGRTPIPSDPGKLYHGTDAQITAFRKPTLNDKGNLGRGTYLTRDVEFAKEYGDNIVEALPGNQSLYTWNAPAMQIPKDLAGEVERRMARLPKPVVEPPPGGYRNRFDQYNAERATNLSPGEMYQQRAQIANDIIRERGYTGIVNNGVKGKSEYLLFDEPGVVKPEATNALHQLLSDESGQAVPGWMAAGAKGALDAADDAFEAGGQAVGGAARRAGALGMAGLTAGADAIAPRAEKLGDLFHIPKAKAEEIATTIANKVDLPGRTGKTADEWYETLKHERAATSSPIANSILDTVRRQLISDFGMTPEQKAIRETGRVAGVEIRRHAEELAVRLGKDRTDADQVDIYREATGMTPLPGAQSNPQHFIDAQAVKSVSRDIDRRLEDLEALPQGMTNIYDGTHLPRGYAKHWQAENQLQNMMDDPVRKIREGITDNRILGSYRRGLDETMSENEFLARQASAAQTGENWRQVSRNQDGSINAHRDWTEAEREKWGEITHASSALQRKANKAGREAEAATVLAEYARPGAGDKHGIFAEPIPAFTAGAPSNAIHPPTKIIRNAQGVDQKYTLVDAKSARDLNVHRYGRLANHYVRDDVLFYLRNENELKPFIDKVNKYTMNNLWKKMVTIGNFPGYFANNFFQNPLILERTGGSMMDMPGAWVDLAQNSIDVQRMVDAGVIRNGVLARELGSQLQHFNKTLSSQHMPSGFSVSKQIFRAMNALKSYEQDAYKLAGASDDLYRVAMVKGLMKREGKTFEEAAEIAKTAFYDSQMVNAPAAQIASTVAPFAKVLWWAANNEAKAWTQNPGKAAYVNALVAALPVAAGLAQGKSLEQQDAEKLSLRKNMQGFGNSFPVPYRDAKGSNYYWDTSNYNHYNQFAPPENTALSLPIPGTDSRIGIPKGLMPGGVPATIGQLMWNIDAFTGKPINTYAKTDGSTIDDNTLNFIARSMSPGSGRNALALYDAMVGSKDSGADATAKTIRYLTGIKLQPANIEEGKKRNVKDRQSDERNFDMLIKKAERDGDLDTAAELTIKKARIIEKAQDKYRRMEKGQR